MSTIRGTPHFVSTALAIMYYRHGFSTREETAVEVGRKLEREEIFIGPPKLKEGQRLTYIDNGTRYAIEE